jgi:hypothetical protein
LELNAVNPRHPDFDQLQIVDEGHLWSGLAKPHLRTNLIDSESPR